MARVWPLGVALEHGRIAALGGVPVTELAARFSTPLYVMDAAELQARMRAYIAAFGPDVTVVYAAKALCIVGVLQLAAREGLAVDVASGGELATALRAGVPGARVVLHGNNKSVAELEMALAAGVGRIVVDSFAELDRLAALGAPCQVLLRVTPDVLADTHHAIATGQQDSKFGFEIRHGTAAEAVERALALPGVELRGLHCHVGSQILALEPVAEVARTVVTLLAEVRDRHGATLPELNLGGGLGVPYLPEDREVAVEDYASALLSSLHAACGAAGLAVPRLSVEPGRSIVARAGVTLYTVGTVKQIRGGPTYVSVDGGMSDHLRTALYGARYTFAAAGPVTGPAAPDRLVRVAGKHCESGDVIGVDVPLPADLAEGDLLAVAATGAYHHSLASNYNRLPRPAMVLVGNGLADVLVRRETLDDLLGRDQALPERLLE